MIYFVETGRAGVDAKDLAGFGLAHIIDPGDGVSCLQDAKGPGGNAGLYVCNSRVAKVDELEGYTWSNPLPGLPAVVRVGWRTKPTPEQLARREQLPGLWFVDADDRQWRVPLIRKVDAEGAPVVATPCYLTFDEKGELVPGEPLAKYRYLADVCDECWPLIDAFFRYEREVAQATAAGKDPDTLPPRPVLDTADVLRWLSDIIATNYYVSARELVLLGVWSTGDGVTPLTWLLAATSYAELLRRDLYEQKKSPASGSST